MALSNRIDIDTVRPRLEAWLAETVPGVAEVSVSGVQVACESGMSCETVLFDARGLREGQMWELGLVARVAPEDGAGLFPFYDLEQEATIMRALAGDSAVPAPSVVGFEGDPELLGGRFLVMERIAGRVPPDDPPYTMRGWVLELAPDEQRRMIDSAVETIAAVGSVDWQRLGLGGLRRIGLDEQLGYLEQLYESGRAGVSHPVLEAGLEYLSSGKPTGERRVLNRGDARIGNMIFGADLSVAGALDWEMAAIGGPEVDIAYLLWA